MKETTQIVISDIQSEIRHLMGELNDKAKVFEKANTDLVQLAWDLGDKLISAKESQPEVYQSMLSGLGISESVEKAWIKVRKSSDNRDDLLKDNHMRQAMLAICVPAKEQGEERIELSPPETFYNWVNKSNSWLKKMEYGLVKCDKEQLKTSTERLYTFLKFVHEGK